MAFPDNKQVLPDLGQGCIVTPEYHIHPHTLSDTRESPLAVNGRSRKHRNWLHPTR
jgi:hypothetical protein